VEVTCARRRCGIGHMAGRRAPETYSINDEKKPNQKNHVRILLNFVAMVFRFLDGRFVKKRQIYIYLYTSLGKNPKQDRDRALCRLQYIILYIRVF